MQEQKLIWDDGARLVVTVAGKIYSLVWIDTKPTEDEDVYKSGWYYDEDGPPGYMGVEIEEVKRNVRSAFSKKQQLDHWHDEDLLYAMCVVLKRLDLNDQGDERETVRDTFLGVYGEKETDLALDLIYQKVLE